MGKRCGRNWRRATESRSPNLKNSIGLMQLQKNSCLYLSICALFCCFACRPFVAVLPIKTHSSRVVIGTQHNFSTIHAELKYLSYQCFGPCNEIARCNRISVARYSAYDTAFQSESIFNKIQCWACGGPHCRAGRICHSSRHMFMQLSGVPSPGSRWGKLFWWQAAVLDG